MKKNGSLRIFLAIFSVFALKIMISTEVFATSRIHFISVGMSDAILIESNGHYALVDASNPDRDHILDVNGNYRKDTNAETECGDQCNNDNTNATAVVKYLRDLGINHLDFVLTTHNHSDHVGGMPTIAEQGFVDGNTTYFYRDCRKNAEDNATSKQELASGAYRGWQNYQYCKNAESSMQSRGAKMYNFDNNARLDQFDFYGSKINLYNVYDPTGNVKHAPDKENRNSIVVKVTDENKKTTLLTSDIHEEEETQLLGIGPVDVLKLSHHGVNESNSWRFLHAMNPKEAVMTNYENCYGRADCNYEALNYLKSQGIKLSVANDTGSIVVNSNQGNLTVNPIRSVSELTASDNTSGWIEKDGKWYYYSNGQPLKGWQQLAWSKGKNWFYFDQNGIMLKNTTTPDGYFVNQDGVWDGKAATIGSSSTGSKVGGALSRWSKIGDAWYYRDDDGNFVTGWQKINNNYYFFEQDGHLHTGWLMRDNNYYYYDDNGNILKNTTTPDGYYVDAHGIWDKKIDRKDAPDLKTYQLNYSEKRLSGNSVDNNSSQVGGTFTNKNSSPDTNNQNNSSTTNSNNTTTGNLSNTAGSSGTTGSSGSDKCVKLAILRINGQDCVDNPEEAIFAVLGMILSILTYGVGIAAGAGFIFSGYQYMSSKNEPAVIAKVKTRIMHIVIGLLLYFTFWGVINLLLPGGVFSAG